MRKVNLENIDKPIIKIRLEVMMPLNDGSGGFELVEAQELCYFTESTNDIGKLFRKLLLDAKEIAVHHMSIMKIRARTIAGANIIPPKKEEAPKTEDVLDPGVDLPAPKVSIRKKPIKKAGAK